MEKIVVFGRQDDALTACLTDNEAFRFVFTDSTEIPPDAACVLISPEFAGENLREIVRSIRRKNCPLAAVTGSLTDEAEEALLDSGITHIMKLPVSETLLKKRLAALTVSSSGTESVEFNLFRQMTQDNELRGAYVVKEADFSNIYRFVQRLQERMDKQAQLVTFSFHTRLHTPADSDTLEGGFRIVQKCLRRGDIACVYGTTILAILMNADQSGAEGAAKRIVQTFEAYCCDSIYTMKYEMQTIKS